MKIEKFEITYVNGMVIVKNNDLTFCYDGVHRGLKKDDGNYISEEDKELTNKFIRLGDIVREISK